MIAPIYKVYRSHRFVFSAKRTEAGRYVLCMFLPRSGQWAPFIGELEHQTLADANARLDEMAKMNHWNLTYSWRCEF